MQNKIICPTFTHLYPNDIYRGNVEIFVLGPLPCDQGKCLSFTFPNTWIINFANFMQLLTLTQLIFFVVKFHHFATKKKSQATWSREILGNFTKEQPHFEGLEIYEMAQIFGGFGQISSFLLLKSSHLANRISLIGSSGLPTCNGFIDFLLLYLPCKIGDYMTN